LFDRAPDDADEKKNEENEGNKENLPGLKVDNVNGDEAREKRERDAEGWRFFAEMDRMRSSSQVGSSVAASSPYSARDANADGSEGKTVGSRGRLRTDGSADADVIDYGMEEEGRRQWDEATPR
jgi:hypothetical protein